MHYQKLTCNVASWYAYLLISCLFIVMKLLLSMVTCFQMNHHVIFFFLLFCFSILYTINSMQWSRCIPFIHNSKVKIFLHDLQRFDFDEIVSTLTRTYIHNTSKHTIYWFSLKSQTECEECHVSVNTFHSGPGENKRTYMKSCNFMYTIILKMPGDFFFFFSFHFVEVDKGLNKLSNMLRNSKQTLYTHDLFGS